MGALALLAALSLTALGLTAAPAAADNLVVKDASGATQTTCAVNVFGVLVPCHLMEGMKAGVPTATTLDPIDGGLTIHNLNLSPGAATAANQATALTSLTAIAASTAAAPTATAQTAGNTSLSSIDGKLTGAATAAAQAAANTKLDTLHTDLTGAATAAAQASGNTKLDTLHADLAAAATAAAQTTGNASLSSIDGKLTGVATASAQATANTKLDTLHTDLTAGATAANQTTANTKLDTLHTDLAGLSGGTAGSPAGPVATVQGDPAGVAIPVTLVPGGGRGSTGLDFSGNTPALPVVGANFGATGPYANYVLVKTIAASNTRIDQEVPNTSGGPIVVLRDDGTAASGATPANASVISLAGSSVSGVQGQSWWSSTFKGRLQIYAPSSTAFVPVMITDGTTSLDFSANKPTIPNVAAAFASSGPYANYVLVGTAAASTTRAKIEVQDTAGLPIAVVLDDGTAASGSAPANATVFALAGGGAAGAQGGSWWSTSFKGRVQVYAPVSTAQVTVTVD